MLAIPAIAAFVALHLVLVITAWRDLLLAGFGGSAVYALALLTAALVSTRAPDRWFSIGVLQAISERYLPALLPRTAPIETLNSFAATKKSARPSVSLAGIVSAAQSASAAAAPAPLVDEVNIHE
jgi:hypothetical protein